MPHAPADSLPAPPGWTGDRPGCVAVHPPVGHVSSRITVPGSKSITNRALILAALAGGEWTLRDALFSRDTALCITALRRLGRTVGEEVDPPTLRMAASTKSFPEKSASLEVGNAGTVARFLTAALATVEGGLYHLDGDPAMRQRPMAGLLEALARAGSRFQWQGAPFHFPFRMESHGLPGTHWTIRAEASSQLLSALLIAASALPRTTHIQLEGKTVSHPFIEMTMAMIRQFGASVSMADECAFEVQGGLTPDHGTYGIEPDATAASYFAFLPRAIGGKVILRHFNRIELQGDAAFVEHLGLFGVTATRLGEDLHLSPGQTPGLQEPAEVDFNAISDTFLTAAALAPLRNAPLRITGIGHTRHQECDRIEAMARGLQALGQGVRAENDSLEIRPSVEALREATANGPVAIETFEDHRVAMSFGILGCHDLHGDGRPWLEILDPACCAKTFPRFFHLLHSLRS